MTKLFAMLVALIMTGVKMIAAAVIFAVTVVWQAIMHVIDLLGDRASTLLQGLF